MPSLNPDDYTLEELEAEARRRGIAIPGDEPLEGVTEADFTLEELEAEARRRGIEIPEEQPISPGGEILGALETGAAIASGVVAEPISGLAGLAAIPFVGGEGAADVVKSVQAGISYDPRTEEGQRNIKAVGSVLEPIAEALEKSEETFGDLGFDIAGPIGGAIASTIPTAALEFLGLAAPKAAARISTNRGKSLQKSASEIRAQVETQDINKVSQLISKGEVGDVGAMADIDPTFIKAADELGINTEPLISFASQNPQLRSVEQALAAIPGSKLDSEGKAFVAEVSKKADELIQRYGGTKDKAELSERFRQESLATIDRLADEAQELYAKVDELIDPTTDAPATSTLEFVNQKSKEFRGKLPPILKKVEESLKPEEQTVTDITGAEVVRSIQPSYALLSQTRKDIGQALFKKSGVFKDAETGLLKALYSRLRVDQDNIAKQMEAFDILKPADSLVAQRKILEDSLKRTLGNSLSGSIMVKGGRTIKNLAKGDIRKFNEFLDDLPENFRKEVVVSSLNDVFRGTGVDQQALNVTQFSKFMDDLDRQPALKNILYRNLPDGASKDLDNLAKLSKGISVAQQDKVRTGVVLTLFDEEQGLIRKALGKASKIALTGAVGQATGSPVAATVIDELLKTRSSRAKAVGDLLASESFRNIITDSVRGGVAKGEAVSKRIKAAEEKFTQSKQFKTWADTLESSEKARLSSLGLVNFLITEQTPEEQEPEEELEITIRPQDSEPETVAQQ